MNLVAIFLMVSGAFTVAFADGAIVDPIADFIRNNAIKSGIPILKLETDLNHDGRKQVFLSTESWVTGKSVNFWNVYIFSNGRYTRVTETDTGDPIFLRTFQYYVGHVAGVGSDVVATYLPGGGGRGVVIGYSIVNRKVHEVMIKQDADVAGSDRGLHDRLFGRLPARGIEKVIP
jgi:hypothetical protein